MTSARWLFLILVLWLGATLWSNALEPATTDLVPSDISGAAYALSDSSLATPAGLVKIWDWVTTLWKALIFDYAWCSTGYLVIFRIILIFFSVAGIYFIADIIWKVRSIVLGG